MRKLIARVLAAGAVAGLALVAMPRADAGGCCGGCRKACGSQDKARLDAQRSRPAPGTFAATSDVVLTSSAGSDDIVALDQDMLELHRRCVSARF